MCFKNRSYNEHEATVYSATAEKGKVCFEVLIRVESSVPGNCPL